MSTKIVTRCSLLFLIPYEEYLPWLRWLRNTFLPKLFVDEEGDLIITPEEITLRELSSFDSWRAWEGNHGHQIAVDFTIPKETYHDILLSRYRSLIQIDKYKYPGVKTNFLGVSDCIPLAGYGSGLTKLSTVFSLISFAGKGSLRLSHSYKTLSEQDQASISLQLVLENSIGKQMTLTAETFELIKKRHGKTWTLVVVWGEDQIRITCTLAHDNSKKGTYLMEEL